MKIFILFIISFICYTNVSGNQLLEISAAIAAKALIKCELSRNLNLDVSGIVVYFYDFRNNGFGSFPIDKAAQGILSMNKLNKSNKFFVYVGGYRSHIKKKTTELIRNAFRYIDNSYLIIVDHSAYTHDRDGYIRSYKRSVKYVPDIGKAVAKMLAILKTGGISPEKIHCIGHSLGSQILGHVGENFIKLTNKKISRITALDPARPCFVDKPDKEHIRSGVARYVEVYHCNGRLFGSEKALGDVDFFANNGKSQPECGESSIRNPTKAIAASKCSHKACVMMWAASILHKNWYAAYKCDKYKNFKIDRCSKNDRTTAGFWNPGRAKGTYYFSTDGYDFYF